MVIFRSAQTTEKGRIKRKKKRDTPLGIITQEQATDYVGAAAWNKLYYRGLFREIRYPEGHVYEDIATTHKIIYQAECIISSSDILIYHRYRKESISHMRLTSSSCDLFASYIQRYNDLVCLGYPEEKAKSGLQNGAMMYCMHMPPSNDRLFKYAEKLLLEVEQIPRNWNRKRKLEFVAYRTNKKCFHSIYRILRKKAIDS